MRKLIGLMECLVFAVLLVLGFSYSVQASGVSFAGAVPYGAGTYPMSVTTGDFNGDGKIDLATANFNGSNVSILLGNGASAFAAAVNYGVGTNPFSVTAGDFNQDGKIDLAVANSGSDNISILLGNGNGTFAAAVNYATGSVPRSVTVGDFNQDGKPDLAVANYNSNNVSILLGNGAGAFAAAGTCLAGTNPNSVTTGDFNQDGKIDLAVANSGSGNVSILLGDGSGGFAAAVPYGVGTYPYSVTTGDFNQDGKLDLVVANTESHNVSVLLGVGDGTFATAVPYATGNGPRSVIVGDFNGDGKADLATANWDTNNASILLGDGTGAFASAVNYATGSNSSSVTTGDFNGDGKPDLAVANSGGNNVSVLINSAVFDSSGTFPAATSFTAGGNLYSIATGDFNRDGKMDFAVCNHGSRIVTVRLGDGNGGFASANAFAVPGGDTLAVVAGDFNRDGKLDLATADGSSNTVSVLLGNGDGTFQTATIFPSQETAGFIVVGQYPRAIAAADVNLDGKLDLVTANQNSNNVSVLLGDGSGGFATPVHFATDIRPDGVAVGDLNRDGKPDIVCVNLDGGSVSVLLGDGTGNFGSATNYSIGLYPISVVLADFNRDGNLDVAVAKDVDGANNVAVLLGSSSGLLGTPAYFTAGNSPCGITTGDFNRDGKVDLATANQGSANVSLLIGTGDEDLFQDAVNYEVGSSPIAIAAADFNRDGRLDLAAACSSVTSSVSGVFILLNAPSAPDIAVSPTSFDFGAVTVGAHSDASTITVTNNGNANLIVGTISITGTDAAEFAIQNDNASGATILPAGSRTFEVVFKPTSTGDKSATVSIPSNDSNAFTKLSVQIPASMLEVPVTGKGVSASIRGGGGCFIATAAFGSYQEPHVWILRLFRDRFLLTTTPGKAFVRFYYRHSPPLAAWIAGKNWARAITRTALLPLYGIAYLLVSGLSWIMVAVLLGIGLFVVRGFQPRLATLKGSHYVALGTLCFLLASTPLAAAEFNVNINHLTPALGEPFFLVTHTDAVLPKGVGQFLLFGSYAQNPLELDFGTGNIKLSKEQSLLSLGLAYGLTQKFQIGLSVPYLLNQSSEVDEVEDSGFGDLRLEGKYRFCGGKDRVGFAAVPFISLATGNQDALFGADNTSGGVLFVLDRNWCNHSYLTFNLGWQTQNEEEVPGFKIKDALLFGVGATRLLANQKTNLSLEIKGRADGTSWFSKEEATPIEALGSITQKISKCSSLTFGLGSALSKGYGAPDFRVLAGYRGEF